MHYVLAISAASRRTKDQLADIQLRIPNVEKVRLADIYIFSCEGPVWIILLFKQLFICVHFYQLCQAEELL
jgi:hypothetical protein